MVNRCSDRLSYPAHATGPLLIRMGGRSLVHPPNPVDNLRPLRRFVTALAIYLTGLRACPDGEPLLRPVVVSCTDRKSTRLNSSHVAISYAVFCLKKKTKHQDVQRSLYKMGSE